jgi:hypothetical protein
MIPRDTGNDIFRFVSAYPVSGYGVLHFPGS